MFALPRPELMLALLSVSFFACATTVPEPAPPTPMSCRPDPSFAPTFERSPGGTPEVSPAFVARHHCNLEIIDVRNEPELVGELGHVPGATWVPLSALARQSEAWNKDEPIVLVDRSGRRSGRAASYLDAEGFERVASVTGGMLAWKQLALPISRDQDFGQPPRRQPTVALHEGPLTIEDIEIHIGDPKQVRWSKAATLLLHGTESCVDGRDDHAVIGTPGGDAGELLAGLATLETVTERPLTGEEVRTLFDGYVEAFGHFYMHTDEHALQALGAQLEQRSAFAQRELADLELADLELADLEQVEDLVRHPPRALQAELLRELQRPNHIGCGHLRLVRLHPEEYRVRAGLSAAFFDAFFRRLWRGDERLEYVVLRGEHEEGAVVNVTLDRPVHAYTEIPMIAPKHQGQEMFVNHPQVAQFIRSQNAAFLLEKLPLVRDVDEGTFLRELSAQATAQLTHTLKYLAAELPVFEVTFRGRAFDVRQLP